MMINNRGSFRLRKQIDISWSIPEQKAEGNGRIYNISLTGMSFETDKLFLPDHGMVMCFKLEGVPAFPLKGKLVWFGKVGEDKKHFKCGIRFLKEYTYNNAWIQWMENNILKLADTGDTTILNRFLSTEDQQ